MSLNSTPKQPEFILIPPPILPGIQDKNSKPPTEFSDANSATFLSKVALPAIIVLFRKKEIFEKILTDGFRPQLALDDRDRVVSMWRSIGLPCFQVRGGKF